MNNLLTPLRRFIDRKSLVFVLLLTTACAPQIAPAEDGTLCVLPGTATFALDRVEGRIGFSVTGCNGQAHEWWMNPDSASAASTSGLPAGFSPPAQDAVNVGLRSANPTYNPPTPDVGWVSDSETQRMAPASEDEDGI